MLEPVVLTVAQVTDLLHANGLTVDFGAERLGLDLAFVEDISADVEGGTIDRVMENRIHGTCTLRLARALTWGVDLVRPYMILSDGVIEARWNVGVFCLTTPDRKIGETPESYDVQGYDRLMWLDRQVGADYTVTAGTTYRAAILQAVTDAGLSGVLIEGSAADDVLPADKTWPLIARDQADSDQTNTPATWLRVVNDLLRAINFRGCWADRDGNFRCEAYRDPSSRAPSWTFDADADLTIVGEDRTVVEDVWATPNRWVFRQANRASGAPPATEGDGIYTVDNLTDGPTSQLERGLVWPSVVDFEAATQAKLVELGDRHVASDRRVTSLLEVSSGPFPGAGHADVFAYRDAAVGVRKVQARSWSFSLDGGDVAWVFERVT